MLRLELTTAAALAACLALAAAAVVLVAPSAALAADRYAEPAGGGDPADCLVTDPCDIIDAVEGLAVNDGDTVIVLPGVYTVDETVDVNAAITVRGQPGAAPPVIEADTGVLQVLRSINAAVVVEDLVLESDFANFSGVLNAFMGNVFQRLQIRAGGSTLGATAAVVSNGAVLRDSIAVSSAPSGIGVMSGGSGGVLSNVTAVGTGANSTGAMATSSFGRPQTMTLRNVIASGVLWDIQVQDTHDDGTIAVDVSDSNFDATDESGPDTAIVLGSGNQTDPPLFVNPGAGDYHQLPGSPTRNAGSLHATTGPLDVDRQPRISEGVLDIGADEFPQPAPAPAPAVPVVASAVVPLNSFDFGKLKRNKKKGTATLFVTFPGPGEYGLTGKGLKRIGLGSTLARSSRATAGGLERLKVRAGKGKKAKRLRARLLDKGKAKAKVRVTYVPTGGTANTLSRKLKLIRK